MAPTIASPSSESPFGRIESNTVEQQTENMHAVIIPMEASSVQRIVAGQAITDLASAVKELIDNALDAGSRTINIRLFNQGLDIVEVSDDGCGVPTESRPFMAMKHATSKIRHFDDIYSTDSLGFRGEALFCLANISRGLVVATRTAEQQLGQKLEFTREGYLRQDTACPVPRKVGTTVAVVKLFDALPVRRADLEKRIHAQRREVFLMVQGYAIHSLGVKFNLFDMSGSGREELRLNTMHGTSKLEETISSVLGSAFLSGMSRISIDLPVDDSAMWTVEGLISKAPNLTARDGTVARNAQFFSINGRPVDLPKVSRTLSDAWRTFEGTSKKKPACVLQFTLPKNSFDVNLSPNKRQVLLTEEQKICDLVHAATLALWSSQRDGKFLPNELDIKHGTVEAASFVSDISPTRGRKVKRRLGFYNDFRSVKLQHDTETDQLQGSSNREASLRSPLPPTAITPSQKEQGQPGSATDASRTGETDMSPEQPLEPIISEEIQGDKPTDAERRQFMEVQERCRQRGNEDEIQTLDLAPITPQDNGDKDVDSPVRGESDGASSPPKESFVPLKNRSFEAKVTSTGDRAAKPSLQGPRVVSDGSDTAPPKKKTITMEVFGFRPVEKQRQTEDKKETDKVPASSTTSSSTSTQVSSTPSTRITRRAVSVSEKVASVDASQTRKRKSSDSRYEEQEPDASQEVEEEETVEWNSFQGTDAVIQASRKARLELRDRRKRLKLLKTERQRDETSSQTEEVDMTSASQAGDDDDKNKIVSLTKKDFEGMQVIGQFNLGFILAKCRKHNLWVLDQHACDEKYNFERLCANTVIHEQKLLAPMPLELSPSEEMCILDNREIFEQNGFRFEYSEDKPPRHRFALTSLPHSGARDGRKAVQFGKDDVRALCAVLGADGHSYSQDGGTGVDGNGMYGNNAVRRYAGLSQDGEKVMTRLPKAVAMFANRACRGSVMIGTALSKKEMETIVHRLANVEHPWNCPHGRPTLKHIKDMLGTEAKDERRTLNHTAGPTVVAMTEMTQPEDEEQQN